MQGKPLQKEEFHFIWETRKQFPSVVARHLSINYAHINGGFRGKDTVADLQKEMRDFSTFRDWWSFHFTPSEKQLDSLEEQPKVKIPDMRKGSRKKKIAA